MLLSSLQGGKDGYDSRGYELFHAYPEYFVMRDKYKKSQLWLRSLHLKEDVDFEGAKAAVLTKIQLWQMAPTVYNHTKDGPTARDIRWPQTVYMAAFDLLKAPDTYSANLEDRAEIQRWVLIWCV